MRTTRLSALEKKNLKIMQAAWSMSDDERRVLECCPYDTEGHFRRGDRLYPLAQKMVELGLLEENPTGAGWFRCTELGELMLHEAKWLDRFKRT